jgi:hypothetical protein
MDSKPKIEFVIIHESLWRSLLNDATTFGFLLGSVAINEWLMGGSGFLNGMIAVMLVLHLFSRHHAYTKMKKTPEQAIRFIREMATTPNARPDE